MAAARALGSDGRRHRAVLGGRKRKPQPRVRPTLARIAPRNMNATAFVGVTLLDRTQHGLSPYLVCGNERVGAIHQLDDGVAFGEHFARRRHASSSPTIL